MSSIGERILQERERLLFTQPQLADACGVTMRSQRNYEKGERTPDADYLAALVGQGLDVLYILKGERSSAAGVSMRNAQKSDAGTAVFDLSAYVQVPMYDLRASAGAGSVVNTENIIDHLIFRREWVTRKMGLDAQALALIDVRGDSMAPTLNDGDVILLDTREGQQVVEGVYAINLDGRLLVKRLRLRLTGVVEVISDNARYGVETITGEQLTQLHIIGRVVWQGRRV